MLQPRPHCLSVALSGFLLSCVAACGGDDSPAVAQGAAPLTVPKPAACQAGDKPETGLQGQVPAALRGAGFPGFSCNLSLVGQSQNEGGNWSFASLSDPQGHTCAYYATAPQTPDRVNPGVPVIDITDRAHPQRVSSLTSTAMLVPWESLRINERRQILVADNGAGGAEVDIYDLSGDCRAPQLLSSLPVGTGADGGVTPSAAPVGHEGAMAPDGLTYYIGSPVTAMYYAVDMANTTKPKLVSSFALSTLGLPPDPEPAIPGVSSPTAHGLSVSDDGNRAYAVIDGGLASAFGTPGIAPPDKLNNGFMILDTSEVQQRKPNAQIKLISTALYQDGSNAQTTIPISVGGKPYLVMVEEGGSAGLAGATVAAAACAAGLPAFPMARIYDIGDEAHPSLASKLMLETHDPRNCSLVLPDITGLSTFTYGSHYCSVDNRENATALACAYFNSGIRVFDIRDPVRPKEIAYYNPASTTANPGSSHVGFGQWRAGSPDWCSSRVDFDFANRQLRTMCQDNGLLVLQFAPGTWPFAQSTASAGPGN